MDTRAYDKGLPCLNPNCKSHGRPHPNCRCYGLAHGGEVSHFCESGNSHNPDCEYYLAEGGMAGQEVPIEDLPDQTSAQPTEQQPVEAKPGQEVPAHDLAPAEESGQEVPIEDLPQAHQPSPTGLEGFKQKGLAYLEGMPGVPLLEMKTGLSDSEKIKNRSQMYPAQHALGQLQSSAALALYTTGTSALNTFLATTGYAGVDEIGKSLMDNPKGDIKKAVGMAVLRGFLDTAMFKGTEALFSHIGSSQLAQSEKWVKMAENAMLDLADKFINKAASVAVSRLAVHPVVEGASKVLSAAAKIPEIMSGEFNSLINLGEGGIEYKATRKVLDPILEKILGQNLHKGNQIVGDAILNQLIKTNFAGVPSAIRYAQKIAGNRSALTPVIKSIMKLGEHEVLGKVSESVEDEIKEWVANGGVDKELQLESMGENPQQGFAKGGEINKPSNHFAAAYPTHNMMLNQIKGRVYGYLNSIRPQTIQSKLPFDSKTEQKDKHREYDNAVRIAASPVSVLNKVNKGNLTPEDMRHLSQMHPEAYYAMSHELTKEITGAQLRDEKPPYKKRQAMSLFLGVNLDSTFTPQAIQTIQGMYAMKGQAQQPQAQKPKKSTSPLSKLAPSAMTDAQARTTREQNQKA